MASDAVDRRIPALDGFRGLLTLFVVASHYGAEIDGGFPRAGVGFVAVDGFFVLSGLLVGRLILDKGAAANFLRVFYLRRVCRTFPIYILCVAGALLIGRFLGLTVLPEVPAWSYFAFLNNIAMALHDAVGTPWLGPTWTMAVEEQFYLVAPALMLATPRRWLLPVLALVVGLAVTLRVVLSAFGHDGIALVALLPTRADDLAIGLACAPLLRTTIDWAAPFWRALPIGLLALVAALRLLCGPAAMPLVGHTLLCAGIAVFLMSLVRGAPEGRRFEGRGLTALGASSFAIYLTHLPTLWFAHQVFLGRAPTLADPRGLAVTALCVPITLAVSVLLTVAVERPVSALGRRARWQVRGAKRPEDRPPAALLAGREAGATAAAA